MSVKCTLVIRTNYVPPSHTTVRVVFLRACPVSTQTKVLTVILISPLKKQHAGLPGTFHSPTILLFFLSFPSLCTMVHSPPPLCTSPLFSVNKQ